MPDTNPPGLYLRVESEPYEVECDFDGYTIAGTRVECAIGHYRPHCPKCHGSGKRTVRLVGYVPVWGWGQAGGRCRYRARIKRKAVGICLDWEYYSREALELDELADLFVEQYRNNKLPDAIRACLEERTDATD